MLASLLPGLRDFRTPLVAGSLYLVLLWIWFSSILIPDKDAAGVVERRLADLIAEFGPTFGIAALGFCAYLIGSLLTVQSLPVERYPMLGRTLGNLDAAKSQWVGGVLASGGGVKFPMMTGLSPELSALVSRAEPVNALELDFLYTTRLLHESVNIDRPSLEMRLAESAPARFDDYDRQQTEASLRLSMIAPLVGLVVTSATEHLIALIGLVVPMVLFAQGVNLLAKARLILVTALVNGLMTSPTQDSARAADEKWGSEGAPPTGDESR